MIKLGDHAIRFNSLKGPFEFDMDSMDWSNELQLIMFGRRPRQKYDTVGSRRRDLIDRNGIMLNQLKPATTNQYCISWRDVRINLTAKDVSIVMEIEFYPTKGPVKPLKLSEASKSLVTPDPTYENSASLKEVEISKPRNDYHKPEFKFFPRFRRSSKHAKRLEILDGDIFYDNAIKYNGNKLLIASEQYIHGEISTGTFTIDDSDDVYDFIKKNKSKSRYDDETLVINNTPKSIMKEDYIRLQLGEKLTFMHSFPSSNVKMTGYLGNGKWCKPQTNEIRRQIYLLSQPSIPPPKLPPKCPKGLLWEEHYLLDKETYIKEIMRR